MSYMKSADTIGLYVAPDFLHKQGNLFQFTKLLF